MNLSSAYAMARLVGLKAQYRVIAHCTPGNLTVYRIGDLLDYDLAALLTCRQSVPITREVTR
jgi:hypothetical protein